MAEQPNPIAEVPAVEKMRPELRALLPGLAGRGIAVHAYDDPRMRTVGWMVIERDGNVGTVQFDNFDGYQVSFMIKPSRTTGSSLMVVHEDDPARSTGDLDLVLEQAERAVGARYANFATDAAGLPNHGWRHFDWCRERLVEVRPEEV